MKRFYNGLLIALFAAAALAAAATHLAVYQEISFFQERFVMLLTADAILMLLLLAVVAWNLGRLILAWRRGRRGVRLSLRLTLLFWGVALLPALLLYTVSVSAVFRGIESWFDAPLGKSFERGIAFGQDVVGAEFNRLEYVARDVAAGLPRQSVRLSFYLNNALLLYRLDSIALYTSRGDFIAAEGDAGEDNLPAALRQNILSHGRHLNLKGSGIDLATEVFVPVTLGQGGVILGVSRTLPADIAEGLAQVQSGQQEYEKLQALRRGLRWSFILTISLSLLLILFAAGWFSLWLGRRLTRPLVQLSAAAEAIGGGDFNQRLQVNHAFTEIAHLNESFNVMVKDLKQSREEVALRQDALHKANAYLENLLTSLTTGVLTFSAEGVFSGYNAAAERFFERSLQPLLGNAHLPESPITAALEEAAAELKNSDDARAEKRVTLPDGRVLLARALTLPAAAGGGLLMMVEDISRQVRYEREATWEEASRRFVHEIKNPLTPIQLAAERLEGKLAGRLSDADAQMLHRLVEMIVNQVSAMRQMVDSFREYAGRRHAPPFAAVPLADLLKQVLYFYENINVRVTLQPDLPAALGSPVALRQLLHNILGNAADALAGAPDAAIDITATAGGGWVRLQIKDNGGGVSPAMLKKLCEPYVTTKPEGTGLGLAIVRKTVEEHGGKLQIENAAGGLAVTVTLPAAVDKKDNILF